MKNADIGLIGLAVMGENLVMNMESHGFSVAVFNRTADKVDAFVRGRARGKKVFGAHSLEELVASLQRPRKIMMMVKAGKPVDDLIETLLPLLSPGDILIDGGNSHFPDTDPRYKGADSLALTREVAKIIAQHGYKVGNIDATILCQRPKLAPHIPAMRQNIADAFGLPLDAVSVKATTEEHLGFTGEGLGIAAHAVALIE